MAERLKAARLDRSITFEDFESTNPATARVLATARRVARSDATLLLLGETGVGKERLARAIHSLGGERPIRVDARIMAATNGDLEEKVRNHRFRADLFYRLAVVSLTLGGQAGRPQPPLPLRPH